MNDIYTCSRQQLIEDGRIPLEVVATPEMLYTRMAKEIVDEIKKNNKQSRRTVLILPVGPIEQYEYFVQMVNDQKLSLGNVTVFNMDEYMVDRKEYIPKNHTLSFRGFMEREVYGKIDPALAVPQENRFFPEPGNEKKVWDTIQSLGGVDLCQGGFGINGHIAFNEPPEQ
jgi:glucosamine-6-phosphate deaminase